MARWGAARIGHLTASGRRRMAPGEGRDSTEGFGVGCQRTLGGAAEALGASGSGGQGPRAPKEDRGGTDLERGSGCGPGRRGRREKKKDHPMGPNAERGMCVHAGTKKLKKPNIRFATSRDSGEKGTIRLRWSKKNGSTTTALPYHCERGVQPDRPDRPERGSKMGSWATPASDQEARRGQAGTHIAAGRGNGGRNMRLPDGT